MPRYYFQVYNETGFAPDEEGAELSDIAVALGRARKTVADIIAEEVANGRDEAMVRIHIDDDEQRQLATVIGKATVTVSTAPPTH